MKEVEIELLIDSFKDEERFAEKIEVTRNGKKVTLVSHLFFKGDRYTVSKARAEYLVSKGIAKIVKKDKEVQKEISE